jgi:6-pyruvoyltetrahydropterin/6-carboxytetrahydropterin synthase
MKASIYRRQTFNAAHRLHNPAWDAETNKKIFGLCNNPNYHGHNYVIILKITGEIDAETGYVMDARVIKEMIVDEVVEPFDHRNLNLDVTEFKNLNPTAENIAIVIWNKIRRRLDMKFELSVTLYETENNYVEYNGKQ